MYIIACTSKSIVKNTLVFKVFSKNNVAEDEQH